MGLFSDIPQRTDGMNLANRVRAAWWNVIRTALISAFGGGVTGETQVTLADNQSSYANVTGLLFDSATYSEQEWRYTIYRTDGTTGRRETGKIGASVNQESGVIEYTRTSNRDDALNMGTESLRINTSTGQGEFKSDSMGGTYVGYIVFKCIHSFNLES